MRLFGSEKMMKMFDALGIEEGQEIQHKMLSDAVERAQKKIETNNFGVRKNLLEYDQVMNEHREIIYKERSRVLNGESMRNSIMEMIDAVIKNMVDAAIPDGTPPAEWDFVALNEIMHPVFPMKMFIPKEEDRSSLTKDKLKEALGKIAKELYEKKEAEFESEEQFREVERVVLLRVIDRHWMNHIDDMDQLRQGIGLAAYGQKDPLVEYRMAGYEMFDTMIASIQEDTVRVMLHVKIEQKVERKEVATATSTIKDAAVSKTKVRTEKKIYPNDPCPCGSGKKYKNCCGRKA